MDLPSKHVLDLSKRIGARGAGSDGESAAASYVLRTFSEFDIEVDVETFSSWKSDFSALIVLYVIAIIAYFAFRLNHILSIFLAITVFLVFQMETYSWGVVSRLLPRSKATNVIGRVGSSQDEKQVVVLTANYDSTRSSPLGRPQLARAYRAIYIISFVCITLILVLTIFGQAASLLRISPRTIFLTWVFCSPFPLYLLLLTVFMSWGEARGLYTAGANDNASGVGVMLSVVASIAGNPLEHTAVWGVATGRGFAGGRGMVALLKRNRRILKDAYIINLDHLGRGDTKVITREGPMLGFRASRRLSSLALRVAERSGSLKVSKGRCRVKKSDAMVANARGFRAITIGGTRGGAYEGWRDDGDVYDGVKRLSLDRAVKFVQILLDEIDSVTSVGKRTSSRRVRELEGSEIEATDSETRQLEDEHT